MSSDQTAQAPILSRGLFSLCRPSLLKKVFLSALALCFISIMTYNQTKLKANYGRIFSAMKPLQSMFQSSPKHQKGIESPSKHQKGIESPPKYQKGNELSDSQQMPIRGFGDSQMPFPRYGKYMNVLHRDLWTEKPPGVDPPDPNNPPLKKILFYNTAQGFTHYHFGFGREPFLRANCPVNTCIATADRNRFPPEEIDALIWQIRSGDHTFPEKRSPHTRYIFWLFESPVNTPGRVDGPIRFQFNWTQTYRLDSDIPMPYGVVYRRKTPVPLPDMKNITASRTKHAAWLVTNCGGPRAWLAKELQNNNVTVDIYGRCGPLKCTRKGHDVKELYDACFEMASKTYKFYLAFENSLCIDYASEKLYNPLIFHMVPVVYGFGNYKVIAPPHSYIDALDFESPKALADYLLYLDKNDTAYLEYFEWKRYHHPPIRAPYDLSPYCEICARLHSDKKEKVVDLYEWWYKEGRCRKSFAQGREFYDTWKQMAERAKKGL